LVVIVGRLYIERLTWDQFIAIPEAAESVKEAGWDWDKLLKIANSVESMYWRTAEEAVSNLRVASKSRPRRLLDP
jgi:hypothetical protein